VVVVLAVFVRYVADPLMARFAKTPELVVIFAIGWAAAAAAAGDVIGLGKELGGLAAGMSLGSSPRKRGPRDVDEAAAGFPLARERAVGEALGESTKCHPGLAARERTCQPPVPV
jgi:Kef-type K+ transport system membrane component KefB